MFFFKFQTETWQEKKYLLAEGYLLVRGRDVVPSLGLILGLIRAIDHLGKPKRAKLGLRPVCPVLSPTCAQMTLKYLIPYTLI